ncbi:MAG: hypothetical protein AAFO84_14090 [Cyanobacteria bacterium J06598_1]
MATTLTTRPLSTQPLTELLFQAGLLAGLGPRADLLASTAGLINAPEKASITGRQKSCISAGNSLILSLRAPGSRCLRIAQQIEDTQRWIHTHYSPSPALNNRPERWLTEFFLAKPPVSNAASPNGLSSSTIPSDTGPNSYAPWAKALSFARTLNAETRAQQYHKKLGCRSHLLSFSQRLDSNPGGWITWRLNKHYSPAAALADCEASWAWPVAAQHFQTLLGRSISKYCRPWSLAVNISDSQPRFRLGTTVWARQPESTEKHRRLADTVEQMGGDSRFSEALYKLIAAPHPAGITSRIGRAAEIEFYDGQAVSMEFFLCVAT